MICRLSTSMAICLLAITGLPRMVRAAFRADGAVIYPAWDLESYLAGLPDELREGPYGAVYRSRLELLRDELATAELLQTAQQAASSAMDFRISNQRTGDHRVPARLLGELLTRWQSLFSALAQAAAGKPTTRGSLPADIIARTALDVVAFAPGSFIARMVLEQDVQPDLVDDALGIRTFQEFEQLCSANRDEMGALMRRFKGRVLSAYIKLMELLHTSGTSLDVRLVEPRGTGVRRASLQADRVRTVLPWLAQLGEPEEENRLLLEGVLTAAHSRTGTFEIDLGEEGTLQGRVHDDSLLDGAIIGKRYRFEVFEVVTRDRLTGQFDTSFTLQTLHPLEGDATH